MAFSHPTAVFIEIDIADPMEAVFYVPMSAVEGQQLPGGSLLRGEVGDTEDSFGADLARFGLGSLPFDPADLTHMGEIEIGIERSGGAKGAPLYPSVALVHGGVLRGGKPPSRSP